MKNFAADKNFGIVDIDYRRMPRHTLMDSKWAALCTLSPPSMEALPVALV